jgi:hypothetical protein
LRRLDTFEGAESFLDRTRDACYFTANRRSPCCMDQRDRSETEEFQLDGLTMNAIETAPNGAVGVHTRFSFHQSGDRVHADYAGGRVERGFLVGRVSGSRFEFCYCQRHTDGQMDSGRSLCELRRSKDSLLRIVEHFEWGGGTGTNIIQELRDGP